MRIGIFHVGNETYSVSKIITTWRVNIRDQNHNVFRDENNIEYDIRVFIRPNKPVKVYKTTYKHFMDNIPIEDPYHANVAEALAAACPYVHEVIESDMRGVLVILRLDADTAEKLAFDAETLKYMRDNPDAVIEVNMYPEIRYASFAAGRKDELPNMAHDDLDYDSLIHDLLELQLSSRSS